MRTNDELLNALKIDGSDDFATEGGREHYSWFQTHAFDSPEITLLEGVIIPRKMQVAYDRLELIAMNVFNMEDLVTQGMKSSARILNVKAIIKFDSLSASWILYLTKEGKLDLNTISKKTAEEIVTILAEFTFKVVTKADYGVQYYLKATAVLLRLYKGIGDNLQREYCEKLGRLLQEKEKVLEANSAIEIQDGYPVVLDGRKKIIAYAVTLFILFFAMAIGSFNLGKRDNVVDVVKDVIETAFALGIITIAVVRTVSRDENVIYNALKGKVKIHDEEELKKIALSEKTVEVLLGSEVEIGWASIDSKAARATGRGKLELDVSANFERALERGFLTGSICFDLVHSNNYEVRSAGIGQRMITSNQVESSKNDYILRSYHNYV